MKCDCAFTIWIEHVNFNLWKWNFDRCCLIDFSILSVNCSHACIIYVKIYAKISSGGLAVSLSIYRGSYMSAHVLFNLLNKLGKIDKMRGLPSILSLSRNEFRFNKTWARMLDSIYHITNTLKSHFWRKNVITLSFCTQRCNGRHSVSHKSINH